MQRRGEDTMVIGIHVTDMIRGCDSAEKFGYRHAHLKGEGGKKSQKSELQHNATAEKVIAPL
jgi:hypothetical protein